MEGKEGRLRGRTPSLLTEGRAREEKGRHAWGGSKQNEPRRQCCSGVTDMMHTVRGRHWHQARGSALCTLLVGLLLSSSLSSSPLSLSPLSLILLLVFRSKIGSPCPPSNCYTSTPAPSLHFPFRSVSFLLSPLVCLPFCSFRPRC